MINYTSIIDILRSGKYIDKTENIEDFIGFKHITLENCKGTGSSLFLKTLACFLDETVDTKDVFCHLEIGKSPIFDKEINSYQLVWLDFSDFKAQSFEEALKYIKEKMSDIYKYHYESFKPEKGRDYRYRELEYALDIIEEKSSYKDLQYSFYTLLYQLKRNKAIYNNINKLAVLIDNLVRLETIAKENGYEKKMSEFIIGFIVEDIYKHCDVFFQIGDNKEETDGWFYVNKDMAYHNFYARLYDIHDRYNSLIVSKKRQYSFMVEPFTPKERDWISCIEHDRSNIQQAKLREKQKRQEQICLEKEKYSEVLSDNVPMLSSNLGIRDKHLDKQTYKYTKLNGLLKDIYEHTKLQIDTDRVYQYLQKTNNKDILIKKTKEYESILKDLSSQEPRWKNALTSIWNGWIQVTYTNRNDITDCSPAKPSNIKVYTNLKDYEAQAIFIESIKHLLKNASDSFAAKICSFQRNDQMCYWVTPEDFKHLEEFYIPLSDKLIESMPFIAYRNKLGISKDFPGVESSHNSTMAHIISDYLKNINSIDQIDLEAMYNNYIAKWNADIYEECDYSIFKSSSVLSFIIILDTLDIILGDSYITDDSLLLYDNKDFWYKLSSSYCWADLNDQFKKES